MFERKVKQLGAKLSQTDLALLQFVSQNPDEVLHMSVRELAAASFTGSTAVVRFYKKLEFESYGDLKLAIARELEADAGGTLDKDFRQIAKATNSQAMHAIATIERQAIRETENLLHDFDLDPILDAMEKASGISVYGTGYSHLAGTAFCANMEHLGISCTHDADESRMRTWASVCDRANLGILVSYSGVGPTAEIGEMLYRRGLTTVAITSAADSPLARAATWTIPVALTERRFLNNRMAPFSSTLSSEFVLDALYAMHFRRHYTENTRQLTASLERQGLEVRRDEHGAVSGLVSR